MSKHSVWLPAVTADPFDVQQMMSRLHDRNGGVGVQKLTHGGALQDKSLFLDPLDSRIYYTPSLKGFVSSSFPFADVQKVLAGLPAENSKEYQPKEGTNVSGLYPLTVVLRSTRTLCVFLDNKDDRDHLVQTITFLSRRIQHCTDEDTQRLKCYALWLRADENGDKVLKYNEVEKIAHELNVNLDGAALEKEFKRFDADGNGNLSYTEFCKFYDHLTTRQELVPLFEPFSTETTEGQPNQMNVEGIKAFMQEVQGEDIEESTAVSMARHYTSDPAKEIPSMTYREFTEFLLDTSRNGWENPTMNRVYQDMKHPLHHYYIASSHNTYLSGDQLQSKSKLDMYRQALLGGCRCVELDCWDGPGDDPVVYHGYTRTSKLKFRDVLDAIKETAFETSKFPVILSLEVHTGDSQTGVLAQLLRSTLGYYLYTHADAEKDGHSKWSPQALQKKILVKWKLHAEDPDDSKDISGNQEMEKARKKLGDQNSNKQKNANYLGRCVYIAACKARSTWGKDAQGFNIESITETTCEECAKGNAEDFRAMNTRMMTRVYPKGLRIDSSNYNPCVGWEHGAQCVALNYQTWDEWMRVNDAKFHQNGRCGYILKPKHLRSLDHPKPHGQYTLQVTIILASQLPKPEEDDADSEIIDPYVQLFLRGASADSTKEPFETKVIDDNGFSPFWNQTFSFSIIDLESAILTLRVKDKDVAVDDDIGESSLPVNMIRMGYRAVPLHSMTTGRMIPNAKLFCHFRMTALGVENEELELGSPVKGNPTTDFGEEAKNPEPEEVDSANPESKAETVADQPSS